MQAKEKEEQERRARLDGIKSEVDYPYILVGDYTVTVVNKAAERTEINFSSIAQGLKKSDLDNSKVLCFYRTDEKAYCLYTYKEYEKKEQYTGPNGFLLNRSIFTYDMILFEYTYLSGESSVLYDFKEVSKSEGEGTCAFIDDKHILLNDKDGRKILDLTTKEVIAAPDSVQTKMEETFDGERIHQSIAPPYEDFNLYTVGGVEYYQRLGTAEFYTQTGALAVTFNEEFFKERSKAYEQLCAYYDGNEENGITRYPPTARKFLLIDGRFFIECRAKSPGLIADRDSSAFVFEYNFKMDKLQYLGYSTGWNPLRRIVLL